MSFRKRSKKKMKLFKLRIQLFNLYNFNKKAL